MKLGILLALTLLISFTTSYADGPVGFDAQLARQAFANGVTPHDSELIGNWVIVGLADVRPGMSDNLYDPNGIPGVNNLLQFALNGFFDRSLYVTFNSTVLAMPEQGPFEVSSVPRGIAFSQFAYGDDGAKLHSYYTNDCRSVSATQLICAMTFHYASRDGSAVNPEDRNSSGQISYYAGYSRFPVENSSATWLAETGMPDSGLQVAFFTDSRCGSENQIALLSAPQTASTCHEYAVENSLQDAVVKSYGSDESVDGLGGYLCVPIKPTSLTFEQACINAFVPS